MGTETVASGASASNRTDCRVPAAAFSPVMPHLMADELGWDDFEEIARDFLNELPAALEQLPVHLASGARKELQRSAHGLKGISLTLGLTGLAGILILIEKEAENCEPARLSQLIDGLPAPAMEGERALREWLRSGKTGDPLLLQRVVNDLP